MNTESAKRPPDTNYELLDKIKKQSMEIARLNAINAVCSLEKRELIEVLAQSARLLDCLDEKMAADKCRAVIERVGGELKEPVNPIEHIKEFRDKYWGRHE